MSMEKPEFYEIGHCGGQVIIHVTTGAGGQRSYQLTWQHARPVAAAMFAVYALPQGIAVDRIDLGGIGQPWNPPPVPGCVPVFIGSDSEGFFGHQCPVCDRSWRSRGGVLCCPYCGIRAGAHQLLTTAQRSYVAQYCSKIREALSVAADGDHVIDMDAVADAVGKDAAKPPFYYTEQSQQNKFTCNACGSFNDILGTFGYCSVCGTRNDVQELTDKTILLIRNRINGGGPYEACVRDAVAAFDALVGQYVKQLVAHVPLTLARKNRLNSGRYHNLQLVATELKTTFDIDILNGLSTEEISFATLMFHRRHVYEHKGGEADEKYIADSGEFAVRPKQALRESQESAHRIARLVVKMASTLHRDFHDILPPGDGPIQEHRRRTSRLLKNVSRRPLRAKGSGRDRAESPYKRRSALG